MQSLCDAVRAANLSVSIAASSAIGESAQMQNMASSTRGLWRSQLADRERWYVVRTMAHRESGAQLQLEAQGFRTFLPRVKRTVRHARKLRTVKSPAFPGYLFVALDLSRDRWRSVNGTYGVISLIMGEELPVPAPVGVVEALIGYVDETGACRFDRDLAEGQEIRVIAGPLAQALGELVKLDANGRVRVLLDIMGGKVLTVLDRSSLAPA